MSFNVGSGDLAAFLDTFDKFKNAVEKWIRAEENHMSRLVELTSTNEMVSMIGVYVGLVLIPVLIAAHFSRSCDRTRQNRRMQTQLWTWL